MKTFRNYYKNILLKVCTSYKAGVKVFRHYHHSLNEPCWLELVS